MTGIASIISVLTGTITSEFQRLIKISSLVLAAVFLALNIVLLFSIPIERQVPLVVAFMALPTVWQVALLTLVLPILGYIINSLEAFFLSLLSGRFWNDSLLLGRPFRYLQSRRYDILMAPLSQASPEADPNAVAQSLHTVLTEFPLERDRIAPTRLGNVLESTSSYIRHQFGAHLNTIWPLLDLAMKDKNEALRSRISDGQQRLLFLVSLTVIFILVGIEGMVIQLLQRQWDSALWGLAAIVLAYITYSAAVQAALTWSSDMRSAFVLYLDQVADQLALRALPIYDVEEKKQRWEEVSRWLMYGALHLKSYQVPKPEVNWYIAPKPENPFTMEVPSTVNASGHAAVRFQATPQADASRWLFGTVLDYLVLVTNVMSGERANVASGVYLITSDTRLEQIPQKLKGELSGASRPVVAEAIEGTRYNDTPPRLLWLLGEVPAGGSCTLRYNVPLDYSGSASISLAKGLDAQLQGSPSPHPGPVIITQIYEDATQIRVEAQNQAATSVLVTIRVRLPKYLTDLSGALYSIGDDKPFDAPLTQNGKDVSWTTPENAAVPIGAVLKLFLIKKNR